MDSDNDQRMFIGDEIGACFEVRYGLIVGYQITFPHEMVSKAGAMSMGEANLFGVASGTRELC